MTLTITLTAELEQRLKQEATRRGLPVGECAEQILANQLSRGNQKSQAVALLQSWIDADDTEDQKETGEFLIRALDEDRPSDRKLFPSELKGVSW